jgi:hypothetical protein
MHPLIAGSLKSKTMIAAAVVGIGTQLAPYFTPDALVSLGLHGPTVARVGLAFAVLMAVCRAITKSSLTEKGTQ